MASKNENKHVPRSCKGPQAVSLLLPMGGRVSYVPLTEFPPGGGTVVFEARGRSVQVYVCGESEYKEARGPTDAPGSGYGFFLDGESQTHSTSIRRSDESRKYGGDSIVAQVQHGGGAAMPLSDSQFTWLWASFDPATGWLAAGTGHLPREEELLLHYKDPSPIPNVTKVAFGNWERPIEIRNITIINPYIHHPCTRIWVIRHGERRDNADPAWKKSAVDPLDPPLTPLGEIQAEETAKWLMGETNGKLDCLYVSPFLRTLQTARPISELFKLPMKADPGIQELGISPARVDRRAEFPTMEEGFKGLVGQPAPGMESMERCMYRCNKWAVELLRRHAGQRLCIVSHAAPLLFLVSSMVKDPSGVHCTSLAPCNPCAVFKLVGHPDALEVVYNGATGHLSQALCLTSPWHPFPKIDSLHV